MMGFEWKSLSGWHINIIFNKKMTNSEDVSELPCHSLPELLHAVYWDGKCCWWGWSDKTRMCVRCMARKLGVNRVIYNWISCTLTHNQARMYVANARERDIAEQCHSPFQPMHTQWHSVIWLDTHLVRIYFVNWRQKCMSIVCQLLRLLCMMMELLESHETRLTACRQWYFLSMVACGLFGALKRLEFYEMEKLTFTHRMFSWNPFRASQFSPQTNSLCIIWMRCQWERMHSQNIIWINLLYTSKIIFPIWRRQKIDCVSTETPKERSIRETK